MGFFRNLIYEQYLLSIPDPTASFASKTVIITGANSGLGKEAARHIAKLGCTRLILGCRNTKAGEEARADIAASTNAAEPNIEVWEVDLSSFDSVNSFVDRANKLDRLDVLICNAGVNTFKFAKQEGYETMLTVNVLSTYLMATKLLPLLERTAAAGPSPGDSAPRPPHLVVVGSDTHIMATLPEKNEPASEILAKITSECEKNSGRFRNEYANSKLLVLLAIRDLVYRQRQSGPSVGTGAVDSPEKICPVIINVANPGLCASNLIREMPGPAKVFYFLLRARTPQMGGAALVNAAVDGWETNGQFLSSNRVHQGSELSWDKALAEKVATAVKAALSVNSKV